MDRIEENMKIQRNPDHHKQGANSVDAAKINKFLDEGKTVQEIVEILGIVETCVQSFADIRKDTGESVGGDDGFFKKRPKK